MQPAQQFPLEEGEIVENFVLQVKSGTEVRKEVTTNAERFADQMIQETEEARERTLLHYGHILAVSINERNQLKNSSRKADKKRVSMLKERIREVKKGTKTMRGFDNPSYTQAMNRSDKPKWVAAMKEETDQMVSEGVFAKSRLRPNNANVIGTMWVLVIKRKPDGSIDKYKARLVALGNQQDQSSYSEISSGTARSATVKMMMSILAKTKNGVSVVLDIKGAYLKSKVDDQKDERLYLRLVDGSIVKLLKYIYGLKQAGYEWQMNVTGCLTRNGYIQSQADESAFCLWEGDQFILMCLHVDDFFVVSSNQKMVDDLYKILENKRVTNGR